MERLRTDRVVSLWLSHPVRRIFLRNTERGVPILMYHSISEGSSDSRPYYNINTSPARFAEQMKFLRDCGYQAVRPSEAVEGLRAGSFKSKRVVITFDDGYRDFATTAYPILKEFGFGATLYVSTGLIQSQRSTFNGRECLSWSEIRDLHAGGTEIGSHSVTHCELKKLNRESLHVELAQSRRTIEEEIGVAPVSFAYPYAFPETNKSFVQILRESLEENGYESCLTTIVGCAQPSSNRYLLPRLPVNSDDDLELFRAKLEGSYDWLRAAQYVSKRAKRLWDREEVGGRPDGKEGLREANAQRARQ